MAAAHGHVRLLPHVTGFTARAMDLAARHGHLDVVKWLHEKPPEGCTTYAMNWAAAFGHLDVVKGFTRTAPRAATPTRWTSRPPAII